MSIRRPQKDVQVNIYPMMRLLDEYLRLLNYLLKKMDEAGYKVFFKATDSDVFADSPPLVTARVFKKCEVPPHEKGKPNADDYRDVPGTTPPETPGSDLGDDGSAPLHESPTAPGKI